MTNSVVSPRAGRGAETFQYDAIGRLIGHASDLGAFTLGYLGQTGQITSRQLASSVPQAEKDIHDHPTPGSIPISGTKWSGDHGPIKEGVGAGPTDDVRIDSDGGIWVKQPDGKWTGPKTKRICWRIYRLGRC
jgi:hypothetical protein